MLPDAIAYLKRSDDVWKTSILGGLFVLFSFLLIPLFLVWGYVIQVVDRTSHGDDEAPVFENWSELTVDGAKAFVVLLTYAIVPLLVGIALATALWAATGGTPGSTGAAGFVLGGFVTVGVAIAAMYAAPAGIANVASKRRIRAGFDRETLRPVLASGTYATRWLLALGIVLVGSFVTGVLSTIPFVGAILGAIVGFYALVAAYYVVGHTWGELQEVEIDEGREEPSTERPAI